MHISLVHDSLFSLCVRAYVCVCAKYFILFTHTIECENNIFLLSGIYQINVRDNCNR